MMAFEALARRIDRECDEAWRDELERRYSYARAVDFKKAMEGASIRFLQDQFFREMQDKMCNEAWREDEPG